MSDDLVRQAIAELQDDVRCRCSPAYKDRGLRDPACGCDSAEAVQVVANRIEELEHVLAEAKAALQPFADMHLMDDDAPDDAVCVISAATVKRARTAYRRTEKVRSWGQLW